MGDVRRKILMWLLVTVLFMTSAQRKSVMVTSSLFLSLFRHLAQSPNSQRPAQGQTTTCTADPKVQFHQGP